MRRGLAPHVLNMIIVSCSPISLALVVLVASTGTWSAPLVVDLATTPFAARIDGIATGDRTGIDIAVCDVNRDGVDDLVIGADGGNGPADQRAACGEAYVVYGARQAWIGPLLLTTVAAVTVYGEDPFDSLGTGVECGDVNGDGFADLVIGAFNANGPNNSRPAAGQVHFIFGGATLPPTIDLATTTSTVLFGPSANYGVGDHLEVGDINGDGLMDVAIDAPTGPRKNGAGEAGRTYLAFGRQSWPATLDLATSSDLIIYAARLGDGLSSNLEMGDLTRDGTSELISVARLGDGPAANRLNCGDTFVFKGRASWPTSIDLATQSADSRVYGADPSDQFGRQEELAVGDLDGDGSPELLVGSDLADGPINNTANSGEIRRVEFGTTLPALVDLANSSTSVIYGKDPDDYFSDNIRVADVNNDGTSDLLADANSADGLNESRSLSGEVTVLFGRTSFPSTISLKTDGGDWEIYGAAAGDELALRAVADMNGDGVREVVVIGATGSTSHVPSIWLVTPVDLDGDGVPQLADNCPLVSNTDQLDIDLDRVGDACETDWDGDGVTDTTDCATADPARGTPPEIRGVAFAAGSKTRITWPRTLTSDRYDILRGVAGMLATGDLGVCKNAQDPDLTDTVFEDAEIPIAGAHTYLVRGVDTSCGGAGSWGNSSSGITRTNSNPATCP